jgi:carbon monoxide dehydrogenase subunit G
MIVSPSVTTTYTLTATGRGGTTSKSVTVVVTSTPPEVTLTAVPDSIQFGESSTLSWSSTNAVSATLDPGIGEVPVSGSIEVFPTETTTYTIEVTGPGGSASASATVTVIYPSPTVTISADPSTILPGQSSTLTWSSTYADTCVLEPDVGAVAINGSVSVSPRRTTTYTMTATGSGGTATAQVEITVIR